MGRFNLLDEAWIAVMTDQKGSTKEISLTELFEHAQDYRQLAGEMGVQDFTMLRFLLAVLHTVFSRFDAAGEPYEFIELDDRFNQLEDVAERDLEDYEEALFDTWDRLWEAGRFPPIVIEYLSKWRDRFYLYDEDSPFYQVVRDDVSPPAISKTKPSSVAGKNMNRLISESGNKESLFSPKHAARGNKDRLSDPEIARWLLTFQGYCGLSDKVIFGKDRYKASKGWPFDIGGITLRGNNLFDTLLLNCMLVHPEKKYRAYRQRPCWESTGSEVVNRLFLSPEPDNLAELYTNWSRAIYMDPALDPEKGAEFHIVKLPEIEHRDNFLEAMTLWRFNDAGENKDRFTPRKHRAGRSVWRSFGLLTLPSSSVEKKEHRQPGLLEWLGDVRETVGDTNITVQAVSMQDDGNATSWVPVDEILDTLNINNYVVTDVVESGWIPRISEAVELTQQVVDRTYRSFISDIKEIRNSSSKDFVQIKVEELYFLLDQPFRNWLSDIEPHDEKDAKILSWMQILKKLVLEEADNVMAQAGPRDFTGILKDGKTKNIATAYNDFRYFLNRQIS